MNLVIDNRIIDTPIDVILTRIRAETGYCKDIFPKGKQVLCTCPFHKNGKENHPSCSVYADTDKEFPYGTFHCFSCGASGGLSMFVEQCFEGNVSGKEWLKENFGDTFLQESVFLPPIDVQQKKKDKLEMPIYEYNNDRALSYLVNKRKLSPEVLRRFLVGYDKETDCVTFPCWDEHGNYVGTFRRSILSKFFSIPQVYPKPVYLLNDVVKESLTEVYVVESQINCLTLWGWGHPSIALFGTGSQEQYVKLNKSGIRKYILAFDGDSAGDGGVEKFRKNVKSAILQKVEIPRGADVNDLTREEFENLPKIFI